nr:PAS domain-containing hybrid sensor histidine kinase/response regulator [Variibacter gotjawalensis]
MFYIGLLFLIASYGDRLGNRFMRSRTLIYPLSLAIYCTSWTFFGSVGRASRTGWDFLTIYIGPVLVVGLGFPLVMRIVRLAKAHNITSTADFIAARYGKGQAVAAIVALIAIVGSIPYIALQLKAVSASLTTILGHAATSQSMVGDLAFYVAFAMAAFAVLFGTRHTDATEHQQGLMLAVATESLVKLFAFLAVGTFVTFVLFSGPTALISQALERPDIARVVTSQPPFGEVLTMTLLSAIAIVLLPRQFHVMVVENQSEAEIRRAAWLFPLYLVLINIFVLPIALAGLLLLPNSGIDSDMFVLALPLAAGSELLTLTAFIGGLSAATAMVIVETVALAIMVSNDIVMPIVLKRRAGINDNSDVGALLLGIRRVAIFSILFLAYVYYLVSGDAQLASIGLLSFAAIAQLAPAFFGGLIWTRGTARGAIAGMVVGIAVWAYTLMLPSFADAGETVGNIVKHGLFGIPFLRPQSLFSLDLPPLVHGVVWSLSLNILAYVAFSLHRAPAAIERVQASFFVRHDREPSPQSFRLWRSSVTVGELAATVSRYLGEERTEASFANFAQMRRITVEPDHEADIHLLRHAEHLLASAIGAASSRLVLSLLLRKRAVSTEAAFKLLDEASAAIHYNREVLQTALDHMRQGIGVFDKDLRLVCWNRQFGETLDVPPERVRVGESIEEILQAAAPVAGDVAERERAVRERVMRYVAVAEPFVERFPERGLVIEARTNRMPDDGIVVTLTDITDSVEAADALERSNETLEGRVRERTEQLTQLNIALGRAKAEADDANISKTRFLAAASHDILQPLNAARLYVTSLKERSHDGEDGRLAQNADASLEAVEEILGTLLDISRLDAGAMKPDITTFAIGDLLRQLELEFAPAAKEKGLTIHVVPSSLAISSDRHLLRRLLQNLISNAIKYTVKGSILVGCRRQGQTVTICVYDTGVGIPRSQLRAIFREFHRLDRGARVAQGLGLGLSIVDRIAKVLGHTVRTESKVGQGSRFSVTLPRAAKAAASAAAEPPRLSEEIGNLRGARVLCIDNEPKILDGMRTMLSGWGCDVMIAPDLEAAISEINAVRGQLTGLLVDYHLDDGNGIDAIMELRWRYGADIPAILITADRTQAVRDQAKARNIVLLNKPVKPAALRALLNQWMLSRAAAE